MLRFSGDKEAIVFIGENSVRKSITRDELRNEVIRLAKAFRKEGVGAGDRVCGYMPNTAETVIAMLATTALGATWCSCATDIGTGAAIDRLGQVEPKILVTTDGYYYKGKVFDVTANVKIIAEGIPSLKRVVVSHYAGDENKALDIENAVRWNEYIEKEDDRDFEFVKVDAHDPLVVMFSSGTTGKPKCMVQSVGGILINQLKELVLHHDIKEGDRLLYITTCSWMMWNWQASALGAGATIILYDGNPSYPDTSAIWHILKKKT